MNDNQLDPLFDELRSLERDVNSSREEFLAALQEYDQEDGEAIVNEFLTPFLADPTRAQSAHEATRQAIDAIRYYFSDRSSIASNVALANQQLTMVARGLELKVFARTFDGIGRGGMDEAIPSLRVAAVDACNQAILAARRIVDVQTLARGALQVRTSTLRAFRKQHLQLSLRDIIARVRREGSDEAKEQLADEAWDKAKRAAEELFEIVLEEEPFTRVRKVLERLAAIGAKKKPDTSAGGTDAMLKLRDQLMKEKELLARLDETFAATHAALGEIIRR